MQADRSRGEGADPADGFREPHLGSATDPSRAGEAGIQGLCPHRSEVYAPALCREAVSGLAGVSQAARPRYLGLRFLLRTDDLVPELLCFLCDPSRQPRGPACPGDPPSHSRMVAQHIVECCGWDREPPRFLIHDRDSRYGKMFDRRLNSARNECWDLMFILSERHLRRVLAEYVGYFNCWRPHRSIGQRAPRAPPRTIQSKVGGNIIAKPVLGGLHHIYDLLHDHPDGYFAPYRCRR
jgi:hypothetical protein